MGGAEVTANRIYSPGLTKPTLFNGAYSNNNTYVTQVFKNGTVSRTYSNTGFGYNYAVAPMYTPNYGGSYGCGWGYDYVPSYVTEGSWLTEMYTGFKSMFGSLSGKSTSV